MTTPTQKFSKLRTSETYEAGKTKKGKLLIAGNVGGVPNPQPAGNIPHATINIPTTTKLGRRMSISGENVQSTVVKRRDYEEILARRVQATQDARLRAAGK